MVVYRKGEHDIFDESFNNSLPCADYCLLSFNKSNLRVKNTISIFNIIVFPLLIGVPLYFVFKYYQKKIDSYESYFEYNDNPDGLIIYLLNFIPSYFSRGLYINLFMYIVAFFVIIFSICWLLKNKHSLFSFNSIHSLVYFKNKGKIWFAPWQTMRIRLWRRQAPGKVMVEQVPAVRLFHLKSDGSLERRFFPVGGFRGPLVPDEAHDMSLSFAHWLKLFMAGHGKELDKPVIAKSTWRERLFLLRGPKPEPSDLLDNVISLLEKVTDSGALQKALDAEPETIAPPTPEQVLIENMGKLKDTIPAHDPDEYAQILINYVACYEQQHGAINWSDKAASIDALKQSLHIYQDNKDQSQWLARVTEAHERNIMRPLKANIAPFRNEYQRFDLVAIERDLDKYQSFIEAWYNAYAKAPSNMHM
ncbi:MAG: hypothetical protein OFPII_30380 [Osedax symbiont Rs1]|nr:MAG: hypothetical protein OFPII_30380 [Osedax symbiont Rs1]